MVILKRKSRKDLFLLLIEMYVCEPAIRGTDADFGNAIDGGGGSMPVL